jgi:hypothetical protein
MLITNLIAENCFCLSIISIMKNSFKQENRHFISGDKFKDTFKYDSCGFPADLQFTPRSTCL